jgi:asparagine synthase (glutamine-hydrolysing)
MCGIAGLRGSFAEGTIAAMSARLAARGPDSDGLFEDRDAGIALAHRRLSIIDLSPAGHQPMADASGRFVLSYNGEIYNYAALRAELIAAGRSLRGHSDTEVLVELFADSGPAALARLNGIFALAIWDRRDRVLWLARDGVGVKPLYLARTPSGIAFASELKALLALPDLDRTIDRTALLAYLGYLYSPGERTMFAQVRKLTPGSWLRIDAAGAETTGRFYTLPDYDPAPMDEAAAIAGTHDALRTAVGRQMVADVEVGAFLSGGLDSSAIVALAREHVSQPMNCFTIGYRAGDGDGDELIADLPYARAAARHLGVTLHEVSVDARIASEFESLVYTLDEPQADPAAINNLKIAALARQQGIKVLLGGAGGDVVFSFAEPAPARSPTRPPIEYTVVGWPGGGAGRCRLTDHALDLHISKVGHQRAKAVFRQMFDRDASGERFGNLLGVVDDMAPNHRLGQHPFPRVLMVVAQIGDDDGASHCGHFGSEQRNPLDLRRLIDHGHLPGGDVIETLNRGLGQVEAQRKGDCHRDHEGGSKIGAAVIFTRQEQRGESEAIGAGKGRQDVAEDRGPRKRRHATQQDQAEHDAEARRHHRIIHARRPDRQHAAVEQQCGHHHRQYDQQQCFDPQRFEQAVARPMRQLGVHFQHSRPPQAGRPSSVTRLFKSSLPKPLVPNPNPQSPAAPFGRSGNRLGGSGGRGY